MSETKSIKLIIHKPLNPLSLYSPIIRLNSDFNSGSIILNKIVYTPLYTKSLPINSIELNSAQRENHHVLVDGSIFATLTDITLQRLESLSIQLTSIKKMEKSVQSDEIGSKLFSFFEGHPLTKGQLFYMKIDEHPIKCLVTEIKCMEEGKIQPKNGSIVDFSMSGILSKDTTLSFTSQNIKIIHDSNILIDNFNFFSLGIGGLKKEFSQIFRRAFLSRVYDRDLIDSLKLQHVKGIILYGPPGTGKTLIARQIGKLLNANEPKVVNGPEILNKYVGQSEENIRELFKDAENEQQTKGHHSSLHIIIFDELDAICKKRTSSSNFTDQVVNQLLSKIDGVNSLNNILVIGMTNRIDLIDSALLRPGRFEIHIEIGLPSANDRKEILEIHTQEMRNASVLAEDVNLENLAKQTNNYTGAELTAVVKSAVSYALERGISAKKDKKETYSDSGSEDFLVDNKNSEDKKDPKKFNKNSLIVKMSDFSKAVQEIKPSFGLNDDEFSLYLTREYYEITKFVDLINEIQKNIQKLWNTKHYSTSNYLLTGEKGTGKTALAVRAALSCSKEQEECTRDSNTSVENGSEDEIPDSKNLFVKIISPNELIGFSDYEKILFIKDTFLNAHKSDRSIIILDNIESLIDYVPIGPRFSNLVLQTIKTFLRMESKGRCFVIGTCTASEIMQELDLLSVFDTVREITQLNKEDFQELKKMDEIFSNIEPENVSIRELLGMLNCNS